MLSVLHHARKRCTASTTIATSTEARTQAHRKVWFRLTLARSLARFYPTHMSSRISSKDVCGAMDGVHLSLLQLDSIHQSFVKFCAENAKPPAHSRILPPLLPFARAPGCMFVPMVVPAAAVH